MEPLDDKKRAHIQKLWEQGAPTPGQKSVAQHKEKYGPSPLDTLPEEPGLEDADFSPIPLPNPAGLVKKAGGLAMRISKPMEMQLRKKWRSMTVDAQRKLAKDEDDFVREAGKQLDNFVGKTPPGGSGKAPPGSRAYMTEKVEAAQRQARDKVVHERDKPVNILDYSDWRKGPVEKKPQ